MNHKVYAEYYTTFEGLSIGQLMKDYPDCLFRFVETEYSIKIEIYKVKR